MSELIHAVANAIARDVAELPDRSSPPDWPLAMLVTADELTEIVERHLADALERSEAGRVQGLEEAAKVADAHRGRAAKERVQRGRRLSMLPPAVRDEILAEERGEDIAAELIAKDIRALPLEGGDAGK